MWFQITRSAESLWWWSAGALLLLSAATAVVYLLDQRQIDRMSVWAKPVKFQLSLAVHFATLALVTTALGNAWRTADLLWWSAVASVASAVFEIGYIMVQAGRAQGSHFNVRNRFYAAMYVLMAVGAVIITIAAASVGIAAWADTSAAMGSAARCGAALGLIGGTVLTFIVAFRMGGALTHHVGTEVVGARRLPLTGWSLTVGDWRVPHFFATHLMQAGPIVGFIADASLPPASAILLTVLISCGWAGFTWVLFMQACRGRAFVPWRPQWVCAGFPPQSPPASSLNR